jgi:hypothetical protein
MNETSLDPHDRYFLSGLHLGFEADTEVVDVVVRIHLRFSLHSGHSTLLAPAMAFITEYLYKGPLSSCERQLW